MEKIFREPKISSKNLVHHLYGFHQICYIGTEMPTQLNGDYKIEQMLNNLTKLNVTALKTFFFLFSFFRHKENQIMFYRYIYGPIVA